VIPLRGLDAVHGERLLHKEIAAVLFFKLAAITLIWYLFFGPSHTVRVTPDKVGTAVFGAPAAPPASPPRS